MELFLIEYVINYLLGVSGSVVVGGLGVGSGFSGFSRFSRSFSTNLVTTFRLFSELDGDLTSLDSEQFRVIGVAAEQVGRVGSVLLLLSLNDVSVEGLLVS